MIFKNHGAAPHFIVTMRIKRSPWNFGYANCILDFSDYDALDTEIFVESFS